MDSIPSIPEMTDISFPRGYETDQRNKLTNKFRSI
jgi:hypothetical protein